MRKDISSRISELLLEQNMTQKDLAIVTGITESSVSHYVKGDRVPRGINLLKIANALGTTTNDLLDQDSEIDKEGDMRVVKTLIARNASTMTNKEKKELLDILFSEE